jgi:pimeloyl-ACP methyl ester carboxylesterase
MHFCALADYVDDLDLAIERLGITPILVGHSLGGVVVQRWLKRHKAPGAVLMGSGPPHGMVLSTMRMLLSNPALAMEIALAQFSSPAAASLTTARKALFSDNVGVARVARHFGRSSSESMRVALELAWPNFPRSSWNRDIPILVLGAERDLFVSPTMVEATARVYGTSAEVFPGMAHAMMLEPAWQTVADRILQWVEHDVG